MILIHRLRNLYHASYEMLHEVSSKVKRHFAGAAVIQNSKIEIIQILFRGPRGTKLCVHFGEKNAFFVIKFQIVCLPWRVIVKSIIFLRQ